MTKKKHAAGVMSVEDELLHIFNDPSAQTVEGVIAVGGKLSPDLLAAAYEKGIFPWPHEGYPLLWFCPDERGVIDFAEVRLPRTFQRWLRKNRSKFVISVNQRFEDVIRECQSQKRKGQSGTWITDEMRRNYIQLHKDGKAVSLEVMCGEELVGGIYGVMSSRYFSCESMFHKKDNASKLALLELMRYLEQRGHAWMDIQMVTPVSESFGGKLISKQDFLQRLAT